MGKRAEKLADRIRQGAANIIAFAEACSDADWQIQVDNEGRTVGTLVHHVGSAYATEKGAVEMMTQGNGLVGVSWEMVNAGNAQHAESNHNPDKADSIALIKANSEACAELVAGLTDEQLDTVGPLSLNKDAPLSMQFFIEDHPIAHPYYHMASIKAVLGK